MTGSQRRADTREIVLEEFLSHSPAKLWRTLTNGNLIARWLLEPTGFAAVAGTGFTFRTTPAGAWDGIIHCVVLEVVVERRLSYSWRSGDADNEGYGSVLDTVVTWSLTPEGSGTRLMLVHSGFVLPRNQSAYASMSQGWRKVVQTVAALTAEADREQQSRQAGA